MKSDSDYIFGDFIAKGGGGKVYHCNSNDQEMTSRAEGRPLAIEIVAENETSFDETRPEAFYQELRMMWVLRDNPHFVMVYGYSTSPVCLIMQYCAYGDLESYIFGKSRPSQNIPYTKHRLVSLFNEYCTAIDYMHSMGVAHCDVKRQMSCWMLIH